MRCCVFSRDGSLFLLGLRDPIIPLDPFILGKSDLQVRFTSILSFQARAPPSQDDRGAVRIENEITVPKRVDSEHAIPQANDNLQDKPANLLPNCSYSAMAAWGFSICS
jgi:hypothetical protein